MSDSDILLLVIIYFELKILKEKYLMISRKGYNTRTHDIKFCVISLHCKYKNAAFYAHSIQISPSLDTTKCFLITQFLKLLNKNCNTQLFNSIWKHFHMICNVFPHAYNWKCFNCIISFCYNFSVVFALMQATQMVWHLALDTLHVANETGHFGASYPHVVLKAKLYWW